MTKQQRLVLIVSILASSIAFLDGSVVNVALPAIARELGGGLSIQQWVVDIYLITLGSLMLLAGSLSDLFGRKKILSFGLIGFGIASVLCAIAPTGQALIAARGLQGIAGALLIPSSLALIMSTFSGTEQGKSIGTWTAWTGISFVVGPLLGGFLVDTSSWRLIFAINVVPIFITLWLMSKLETLSEVQKKVKIDLLGGFLGAIGLGGPVYAFIEQPHYGWSSPMIVAPLLIGTISFIAFIWHERTSRQPMLPMNLFESRNFTAGNIATAAIYGSLSIAGFSITIFLQQVGGWHAFQAGLALLPITIILFALSPKFGALSAKYGPRFFMTTGPIVAAFGFIFMSLLDANMNYWAQLLPGILLFGLGLSMTVAPLTAAVLSAINQKQAGIASAVNNTISRVAGLVGISIIGLVTGPQLSFIGFRREMLFAADLLVLGGLISWIGIRNRVGGESPKQQSNP